MLANVMKIKYHIIRMMPYFLSNFQPFKWVATTKNTTVDNRDTVEYVSPERVKLTTSDSHPLINVPYLC